MRASAVFCLAAAGPFPAHAQSDAGTVPATGPTLSAEAAFDLRAYAPPSETVDSRLHGSFLRIDGETAPDAPARSIGLHVFGVDQYGSYRWQQASVEKDFGGAGNDTRLPNRLQAGILRIPFGVYDYRETYGSGLIDYPLPRVDYAYDALDWGVTGAQWSGGTATVQGDIAAFGGRAAGLWGNFNEASGVAGRAQFFAPPNVIVGVSGWNGRLSPFPQEPGRNVFVAGTDLRYTLSHLMVRGEAFGGAIADARRARGAYLDAYYRLPGIETVSVVGRVEALKPDDSVPSAHQLTLGVRWAARHSWTLSANWRRNNLRHAYAFTWTPPAEGRGDLLFQALKTFRFDTARP